VELITPNSFAINPLFARLPEAEVPLLETKEVKVFLMTLTGAAVGGVIGAGGGFVFGTVVVGVAFLVTVGAVAGGIFGYFYFSDTEVLYRLRVLDRLELVAPALHDTIQRVRTVLARDPIHFNIGHDNHAFHREVTVLTDEAVKTVAGFPIKRVCGAFLASIHGIDITYEDGTYLKADLSPQIGRLIGHGTTFHMEELRSGSPDFERDVQQLHQLQIESFGRGSWLLDAFRRALLSPDSGCMIAREAHSQNILGGLVFWPNNNEVGSEKSITIASVWRKANMARIGVADEMFKAFLNKDLSAYSKATLHVRVSNTTAQALYRKFGFEEVPMQRQANYYQYPTEDAYVMELQKANFQKFPQPIAVNS
jgi:ribosomal-protein-alanine N-acetyltransferase